MKRSNQVTALFILVAAALAGCQPTVVAPSGPRAPTDPASIKIYDKRPAKYEDLGLVQVAQGVKLDENFSADQVVDRMKAEAAARGANGLLLWDDPDHPLGKYHVGGFYQDQYHTFIVSRNPTAVLAKAIYVLEK